MFAVELKVLTWAHYRNYPISKFHKSLTSRKESATSWKSLKRTTMESVMREQWPTVPVPSPQLAVSVPQPLPLEVLGSHHRFVTPIQRITSEQALASWLSTSTALRRLLTFIQSASVAVANKPNSASNVAQVAPVNNDRLISWDQHESHTIAWQIERW